MSSLIGYLGKAIWKPAAAIAKGTAGGPLRRMVLGSAIGGMYGAATSDSNTATGKFRDVMMGAAGGLAISGGLNMVMSKGVRSAVGKTLTRGIRERYNQSLVKSYVGGSGTAVARAKALGAAVPKWPASLAKGTAKAAYKTGRAALSFAAKHPALIGTGIALGYGYSVLSGGQNQDPSNAMLAQQYAEMGAGTEDQRMTLQNSTYNLVQGLNQRRHGI